MKKNTYLVLAIALLGITTACEKWLDVQPRSQVKADELFETEAGYKEALAGVYTILTDEALYGKELTYGMMGVLSHEWTNFSSAYDDDAKYDYIPSAPRSRIEGIWSNMYKAISNANAILENLDKNAVFTGDNYAIIKGETLALRAFIHFDLLRCFGVNYATNKTQVSIPYVALHTSKQTPQSTVEEIVNKVIEELKVAKELLKVDPIYTGKVIYEYDDNGYLINRQVHLNYYAVEALLARVYLYKGDYVNARLHAKEIIDAEKFTFTTQQHFIDQIDLAGAPEQIFALQIYNLHQYADDYYLSQEGERTVFSLTNDMLQNYYGSDRDIDYRYEYSFKPGTMASADNKYTLKYSEPKTQATNQSNPNNAYYREKLPVIKLSEMYYILAECDNADNISPLENLNIVRRARGIPDLTSMTDFRTTMTNEFRKDFFAEGQLFYYYKRLNLNYIQNSDQDLVAVKGYTFPIPDSEYEAADRKNNR